jgi:aerotaxis receptor
VDNPALCHANVLEQPEGSPVSHVTGTLEGIRQSSIEQQQGIAQINEAVAQMDSITQQNAAMVEQLAASAQSLNGQVDAVDSSLRLFRLVSGEKTVAEVDAVALRRASKQAAATPKAASPVAAGQGARRPPARSAERASTADDDWSSF